MTAPQPKPEPPEPVTVSGVDPIPQRQPTVEASPPPQQGYQSDDEARANANNGNVDTVRDRRLSSAMIVGGASRTDGADSDEEPGQSGDPIGGGLLGGGGGQNSELGERLQPTRLEGGRASVLRNRD